MTFVTFDLETVPQWQYTHRDTPVDERWLQQLVDDVDPTDWPLREDYIRSRVISALRCGEARLASTGVPAALHPATCHVVSVSFAVRKGKSIETSVYQWDDYDRLEGDDEEFEDDLLTKVMKIIAKAYFGDAENPHGRTIVTFNGTEFDLWVLRIRCAILGVPTYHVKWDGPGYRGKKAGLLYPYDNEAHCDLRRLFTNGDRRGRGTLSTMAHTFGVDVQEHGADIYDWFRAHKWDSIREYGQHEGPTLVEIFERCLEVL